MKTLSYLFILALVAASHGGHATEFDAELDWSGRVALAMPVTGVVESVTVKAGQRVRKGDILVTLNPVIHQTGVMEARAEVDRQVQDEADARRDLERVKELYARTVSATTELDAAQLRHFRATASLAVAQARLEKARRQLEETELRAPFDAIVLARMVEPGLIAATPCQPNPLFAVARADELLALALLNPDQAARIEPGNKAEVLVGGRTLKGEVRGIGPANGGKYRLEVAFPREKGFMPGQSATIRLP